MTMLALAMKVGVTTSRAIALRARCGEGLPSGRGVPGSQAGIPPDPLAPSRSRSGIRGDLYQVKPAFTRSNIVIIQ